jgi:hypothetical protein
MRLANDGLRFLLEMWGVVALALWGFAAHSGLAQWLLALGIPFAVAVVWVVFVNPNGSHVQADPSRLLLELAIFGSGTAALFAVDRPMLGYLFAGLVALHLGLTFALG